MRFASLAPNCRLHIAVATRGIPVFSSYDSMDSIMAVVVEVGEERLGRVTITWNSTCSLRLEFYRYGPSQRDKEDIPMSNVHVLQQHRRC